MTTTDDVSVAPPVTGGRPRRWWLGVAIVLVALLVAGSCAWWAYAAHYQPFTTGIVGEGRHGALYDIGDGVDDEHVILVGPPGTTARLVQSLVNEGDVSVRLDVPRESLGGWATDAEWAPAIDHLDCGGCLDELHRLPVTVRPHQDVQLVFTVRQPRDTNTTLTIPSYRVSYEVYGVHHEITVPFRVPLVLNPPPAALKHIDGGTGGQRS